MDHLTCTLINGPLVILNIVANVFFICCMVQPLHGERIKQPLKILLWSLICCTIAFMVSAILMTYLNNLRFTLAISLVSAWCLSTSLTSSVWLNFFYYTQIVPAQTALFIWIKTNIKAIIYSICLCERLLDVFMVVTEYMYYFNYILNPFVDGFSYNFTMHHNDTVYSQTPFVYDFAPHMLRAQYIFCLCVMVMSSGSTVVYLCRHMRRMAANGLPLTCPQLRSQVRVTVTGILQGVLYVICAVWTLNTLFEQLTSTVLMSCLDFTVFNFYMAGTTFSLGVGQSVFRKRAADLWLRASQFCKGQSKEDDTEARTGNQGPDL